MENQNPMSLLSPFNVRDTQLSGGEGEEEAVPFDVLSDSLAERSPEGADPSVEALGGGS